MRSVSESFDICLPISVEAHESISHAILCSAAALTTSTSTSGNLTQVLTCATLSLASYDPWNHTSTQAHMPVYTHTHTHAGG